MRRCSHSGGSCASAFSGFVFYILDALAPGKKLKGFDANEKAGEKAGKFEVNAGHHGSAQYLARAGRPLSFWGRGRRSKASMNMPARLPAMSAMR